MNDDLPPRARRHERTKDAILNSARKMIRDGGVDSISMRKIAQDIDYSPAGLYEYFGSKEEIIGTLCQMAGDRLENYMKAVDSNLPIERRMIELGLAYIRFAVQNREEFLVLFTYMPMPPELNPEIPPTPAGAFAVLMQAVQEAMDTGHMVNTELDAFAASYAAWAIVHGMAMLQLTALQNTPFDFETVNRWALQHFTEGLRAT
ncbi:MAG TPA: TetR/AcrR family transcriptional regulator [Anaerolineales bacterium]|nr:TetR/AcrR family transcriptional regulator [Anaerolineales bacterium]